MGSSYYITYGGNRLTFPGATGSVAWEAGPTPPTGYTATPKLFSALTSTAGFTYRWVYDCSAISSCDTINFQVNEIPYFIGTYSASITCKVTSYLLTAYYGAAHKPSASGNLYSAMTRDYDSASPMALANVTSYSGAITLTAAASLYSTGTFAVMYSAKVNRAKLYSATTNSANFTTEIYQG